MKPVGAIMALTCGNAESVQRLHHPVLLTLRDIALTCKDSTSLIGG
jgi:hypothetical protein